MNNLDSYDQKWLYNFRLYVLSMIEQAQRDGYTIKAVIISDFIIMKMSQITGYEVNQVQGYVIERLEDQIPPDEYLKMTDDEIKNYVGLKKHPLH